MSSANLSVLVGKNFVCIKIAGRANFASSPDFKTLLSELAKKEFCHFIIDLSECVLMDSTFLGVLAGFGMKLNPQGAPADRGIELPVFASPTIAGVTLRDTDNIYGIYREKMIEAQQKHLPAFKKSMAGEE